MNNESNIFEVPKTAGRAVRAPLIRCPIRNVTVSPGNFTGRICGPSSMTVRVTCPECGKTLNTTGNFKTNIAHLPPHNRPRD